MALRPKGAKLAAPAPAGQRMVQLIWPAWFGPKGEEKKYEKDAQLAVPDEVAERWHAAGVAAVID